MASGNYGTWTGVSKQITVRPGNGASVTMSGSFGNGDSGFTVNGQSPDGTGHLTMAGLDIIAAPGPTNIAVVNTKFSDNVDIDGPTSSNHSNILFDHDDLSWTSMSAVTGTSGKIRLPYNGGTHSGVTVQNSYIANGDEDGIQTGTGLDILHNEFTNLCDVDLNHTDNIQFVFGGSSGRIAGNYIHETCTTQGITSYDSGTNGMVIEDNVVDIHRAWGIEWYSDTNSIIRHNTVVYHGGACYYNSACGYISIDRKPADPAGTGTQVYDNIALVSVDDGSTTARNDHNYNGADVTFVGPTTSYAGYKLTSTSAGHLAADDGTNLGARIP
jgi:hypothetical protein